MSEQEREAEADLRSVLGQPEVARAIARSLIRGVLKREPEESAVRSYAGALAAGYIEASDGYRESFTIEAAIEKLTALGEFGSTHLRHATVTPLLARPIIETLMERDPGEFAIASYSESLSGGYSLNAFIRELVTSEEFAVKMRERVDASRPEAPSSLSNIALGTVIEDLVLDALLAQGCFVTLPPLPSDGGSVGAEEVIAALHTLSAMAIPGRQEELCAPGSST